MAENTVTEPVDAAEKAYAVASEAKLVTPQAEPVPAPAGQQPVEFKPKRATPRAEASKADAPKVEAPIPVAPKKIKPAAKAAKPAARKAKPKITTKAAAPKRKAAIEPKTTISSKESPMATKKTAGTTGTLKKFVADAQAKAKVAYAKGGAVLTEAGEFTKGNVQALAESGKILAAGTQDLGKACVAETKTAIETAKADIKALAAVKTPGGFFKLQNDILLRNFDDALALGSKNTKAVFKLANDTFAPISGRVALAVEKVKKAA
ncbi:MAG: phasin family protein [Novosphingobium sp.]